MPTEGRPVPIIAPKAAFQELRRETEEAVLRVLASGDYVLGEETALFEREAAAYLGAAHGVGVSSGTEALLVALQDLEVGPGDEVVVPCFTFIATATVVARLGAKPAFVDIDPETFQMSPRGLAAAITARTRAVIPVHLYGHAAPLDEYRQAIESSGREVPMVEDAAQAIGTVCRLRGRPAKAGTVGLWGCFSFYPTKNLPACGEAGLMVTSDARHAERALQLRNHGQDAPYRHRLLGGNARLDAIQSAVLRVRLRRIEEWNERRRAHAAAYDRHFRERGLLDRPGIRLPPRPRDGEVANYHQYTVRVPRRDELKAHLAERGIQTGVYYPIPVSLQPVFERLGHVPGDFPAAEAACREVLSLPVHQHLAPGDVERVVAEISGFYRK
ncbi:MAG: DegT/DnrJ/EryC1/StrS family aminotransferase [Planctomycetes bacterium]|nr:DegT/DnrJ/EryC1/StrS family aminotransferase [Planctomycetota bacterium]